MEGFRAPPAGVSDGDDDGALRGPGGDRDRRRVRDRRRDGAGVCGWGAGSSVAHVLESSSFGIGARHPPRAGHGTGGQLVGGGASRTATNWFTASMAPGASAHHGRSVPSVRRTAMRPCAGSSSV